MCGWVPLDFKSFRAGVTGCKTIQHGCWDQTKAPAGKAELSLLFLFVVDIPCSSSLMYSSPQQFLLDIANILLMHNLLIVLLPH